MISLRSFLLLLANMLSTYFCLTAVSVRPHLLRRLLRVLTILIFLKILLRELALLPRVLLYFHENNQGFDSI